MNIFNANYNPGSVAYYKTNATSKSITGGRPNYARPTRDRSTFEEDIETNCGAKVIGVFGIVDRYGKQILSGWKHSAERKDRLDENEKPTGWSEYGESLQNAMFKGW